MRCAPGVSSGSAKDAVKSGSSAGPKASVPAGPCDASAAALSPPPAQRGLVDLRSSGTRLASKAFEYRRQLMEIKMQLQLGRPHMLKSAAASRAFSDLGNAREQK
jgi:hypothetical protein